MLLVANDEVVAGVVAAVTVVVTVAVSKVSNFFDAALATGSVEEDVPAPGEVVVSIPESSVNSAMLLNFNVE